MYIAGSTNRIDVKVYNIPFNCNVDSQGISTNSNINTAIEITSKEFNNNSDGSINANIELNIVSDISKMMELKVIDNIEIDENSDENIYSIVVYFVKPGDTLWNIAKKFKSTINAIASVNGLEDENKINVGQQLFIPKFV